MVVEVRETVAKDGTTVVQIYKDDHIYMLNSGYKPYVEAEKYAKQYAELDEGSVLVVFGFGNGIFPSELIKMCPKDVYIIFYEPCKEMKVYLTEDNFKQRNIATADNWCVVADGIDENQRKCVKATQLTKVLEKYISFQNEKQVIFTSLPKYIEAFSDEYRVVHEQVLYRIRSLQASRYTAQTIGSIAVENNIRNLRYLLDSVCGDSLKGSFPDGFPVIIVSAGPSLEKNIDQLSKAKNHALIIGVDTAVQPMLDADICPDIIVSVDPRKELTLFSDERMNGIPIVGCTDMSYRVLERMNKSRVIFSSTENPFVENLYAKAGHEILRIESGGSVATMAYSLSRYWGFHTIILVGQDLALTGMKMYANGAKLNMDQFHRDLIEIPDIYGNAIYTVRDYYYYLKWFESRIQLYPDVEVIDATEGGARIEGSRIMSLADAIKKYGTHDIDVSCVLKQLPEAFAREDRLKVRSSIKESWNIVKRLLDGLERGKMLAQQGILYLKEGKMQDCVVVEHEMEKICDEYNALDESFLIQRQIDATQLERFESLFGKNVNEKTKQNKYQNMLEYFDCLAIATETVLRIYDETLKGGCV